MYFVYLILPYILINDYKNSEVDRSSVANNENKITYISTE